MNIQSELEKLGYQSKAHPNGVVLTKDDREILIEGWELSENDTPEKTLELIHRKINEIPI